MTTPLNQQFTPRSDSLWADNNIDLSADHAYKIDNIPVVSYTELGLTVTKSNLRQVGTLTALDVSGNATLGDFAFFNSTVNRVGLGTSEPNAAISILENDVEIGIGSHSYGVATIGTYSNSNLSITTDNISRILIKNSGEIVIGDEVGKSGVVTINGTLNVTNFVSDTRIERTSSLEFKPSKTDSIYGLGLVWSGSDTTRSLVLSPNPERLWSSVSLDLKENSGYFINGEPVINSQELGSSVVRSNLIKVGALESLLVTGDTTVQGLFSSNSILAKDIVLNNGVQNLSIELDGLNHSSSIKLAVKENEAFYADDNEIILGNPGQNRRSVKVFGNLSVGVNNPDPDFSLAVSGNIMFGNKKFITGTSAPVSGTFSKGDICWNDNPQESSYVGWVCVDKGTPGRWLPFGSINRQ